MSQMLVFSNLVPQVVKQIRKKYSQVQMSKKLGLKPAVIQRWEQGKTLLKWKDFIKICRINKIDIDQITGTLFQVGNAEDISKILRFIEPNRSIKSFSSSTGRSTDVVKNWRTGRSTPSTLDVFRLMYDSNNILFEFLRLICDPARIPEISEEYKKYQKGKSLHYLFPYCGAALRCLELYEYQQYDQHPSGYLAKKLGISEGDERALLDHLLREEIIVEAGKKYKTSLRRTDLRANFEGNREVKLYWLNTIQNMLKKMEQPNDEVVAGHLVYSCTDKTQKAIKEEYLKFYHMVSGLIENDKATPTGVHVLLVQQFRVDG